MKLWIDEDLSPSIVHVGHDAGYHATSVRDRGRLSSKDHALAAILLDEEWVLVTNNAGGFLKRADTAGLHSGLVFIELGSTAAEAAWFSAAISHTASGAEARKPRRAVRERRGSAPRDCERKPGNRNPRFAGRDLRPGSVATA